MCNRLAVLLVSAYAGEFGDMGAPLAAAPIVWTVERVKSVVARALGFRVEALTGQDRHKSVAFARHAAMYLCRHRAHASYPEIARAFDRDHTSVMSAVKKIKARSDYLETVETIEREHFGS